MHQDVKQDCYLQFSMMMKLALYEAVVYLSVFIAAISSTLRLTRQNLDKRPQDCGIRCSHYNIYN